MSTDQVVSRQPDDLAKRQEIALAGILCRSGVHHEQPELGAPYCSVCAQLAEIAMVAVWEVAVIAGRRDALLAEATQVDRLADALTALAARMPPALSGADMERIAAYQLVADRLRSVADRPSSIAAERVEVPDA